jgi:hypothetical protein
MFSLKRWLLCAALALSPTLTAAPPLTTMEDVLFNADATRFNGVVIISWQSFEASDATNVAAGTKSLTVTNGILYCQLVPTTNANTVAIYTVQYTSTSATQFTEAWAVPPSSLPLRVRDVRVAPGSIAGSGPPAATIIQISDVTGLQNALNLRTPVGTGFAVSRAAVINSAGSIDGALGILTDCLHVDGTSGACGTGGGQAAAGFTDGETPSGTLDGSNAAFSLASAPNPTTSLAVFRNGLLLKQGADYTLSGSSVTFQTGAVPQTGDVLLAFYRVAAALPGVGFVDQETPGGAMNGLNASFTLSQTPSPAASLAVFRNGIRLTSSVDYTANGAAITFVSNFVPQGGDTVVCSYRIAQ